MPGSIRWFLGSSKRKKGYNFSRRRGLQQVELRYSRLPRLALINALNVSASFGSRMLAIQCSIAFCMGSESKRLGFTDMRRQRCDIRKSVRSVLLKLSQPRFESWRHRSCRKAAARTAAATSRSRGFPSPHLTRISLRVPAVSFIMAASRLLNCNQCSRVPARIITIAFKRIVDLTIKRDHAHGFCSSGLPFTFAGMPRGLVPFFGLGGLGARSLALGPPDLNPGF